MAKPGGRGPARSCCGEGAEIFTLQGKTKLLFAMAV